MALYITDVCSVQIKNGSSRIERQREASQRRLGGEELILPPLQGEGRGGDGVNHAEAIPTAARRLVELRDNWLNPPEWVDWVITPEEERVGYPKRPIDKPGHEADLKKRTLTNLYNTRAAWLDNAHSTLDKAVAAAYGWNDYTPEMADETILGRLLALNLERVKG